MRNWLAWIRYWRGCLKVAVFRWRRRQKYEDALDQMLQSHGNSEESLRIMVEHALGRRVKPSLKERFGEGIDWAGRGK